MDSEHKQLPTTEETSPLLGQMMKSLPTSSPATRSPQEELEDWSLQHQLMEWFQQALLLYRQAYVHDAQQTLFLTGVVLVVLFSLAYVRLLTLLLALAVGCLAGYAYAAPDLSPSLLPHHWLRSKQPFLKDLPRKSSAAADLVDSDTQVELLQPVEMNIAPAVHTALHSLLDLFVRDFIVYWFDPLNISKSSDFENLVRLSVNKAVMNFVEYGRYAMNEKKNLELSSLLTYGFVNNLIIHMREYRVFEASGFKLEEFISTIHDQGSYLTETNFRETTLLKRVKEITGLLLKRLLPEMDVQSLAMSALLNELVASYALWPIIVHLSKPETMNGFIIQFLVSAGDLDVADPKTSLVSNSDDTRTGRHDQTAIADPLSLTMETILLRNDTFSGLMEFMESINAPPFLRFWTNADIYRQFASIAVVEQGGAISPEVEETMRSDAMYVFDAHFTPQADLRIFLNLDAKVLEHDTQGQSIIDTLLVEIRNAPNPECFRRAQRYVLTILDKNFLEEFKKSAIFKKYFLSPLHRIHHSERDNPVSEISDAPVSTEHEEGPLGTDGETSDSDDEKDGTFNAQLAFGYTEDGEMSANQESLSEAAVDRPSKGTGDIGTEKTATMIEGKQKRSSIEQDPILHIAAAVTSLREQLLHVETAVEQLKPSGPVDNLNIERSNRLKKLKRTKRDLELQIANMLEMANELDNQEVQQTSRRSSQESQRSANRESAEVSDIRRASMNSTDIFAENLDSFVDLSDLTVVISPNDIFKENQSNENKRISTSFGIIGKTISTGFAAGNQMLTAITKPNSTLATDVKKMTFIVRLNRTNIESEVIPFSWKLVRPYKDFVALHSILTSQFSKVSKIPFPSVKQLPVHTSKGLSTEQQRDLRLQCFCTDLQVYLQMLLGDALLRENRHMQLFFKPPHPVNLSSSKIDLSFSSLPTASTQDSLDDVGTLAPIDSQQDHVPDASKTRPDRPLTISTDTGKPPKTATATPPFTPTGTEAADLPLLIDTAFALLTELFDLQNSRQWLRRRALSVLRQFLLQSCRDRSGQIYIASLDAIRWWVTLWREASQEGRISSLIDGFRQSYWPNNEWYSTQAEANVSIPNPVIEKQQAEHAKKQARKALLDLVTTVSGTNRNAATLQFYLHRMVGRQNATQSIRRVFEMLQHEKLNRLLVLNLLETIVRLIFADDRRKYK